MTRYKTQISEYISKHKNQIISELMELIRIPSVRGNGSFGAPFGDECKKALIYARNLYEKNGFEVTENLDDGYFLSHYGNGLNTIGIFSHIDVVPVDDNWIFSKPFEPTIKDGYLFGRGSIDDKSGMIISLYILKMCKELNIPLKNKIVAFTGSNEESGMEDIKAFVKGNSLPKFSLVPDSAFPVYNGNKGILIFNATSKDTFSNEIIEFSAENKSNIPANAILKVRFSNKLYDELLCKMSDNIQIEADENEITVISLGVSRHSALPDGAINAIGIIARLFADCESISCKDREIFRFISLLCDDFYGEKIGISCLDENFGKLSCANVGITLENNHIALSFNIRFGKCTELSDLKKQISSFFSENNYDISFQRESIPRLTDANSPYIQKCLSVFCDYSLCKDAKARINAGGTYAMYLPLSAETGTSLYLSLPEYMPQGHGHVHQPDECINIDELLKALELNMLMLLECDKIEE